MIDSGQQFLRCCAELLELSNGKDLVIVKAFKMAMDGLKGLIDLVKRLVNRELGLLEPRRRF